MNTSADPSNRSSRDEHTLFADYWKGRGITCQIPVILDQHIAHYLSYTQERPVKFQRSFLTGNNGYEAFKRLNYPGRVTHYLYIPNAWEDYAAHHIVYVVEGIPDTLTLKMLGLPCVGMRSAGAVKSGGLSELDALCQDAHITTIVVIPDVDAWDLWCHAFKEHGYEQNMLKFVNFPRLREMCHSQAKDMNALFTDLNDSSLLKKTIQEQTVHQFAVKAHYDLDAINERVDASEIKTLLCQQFNTTATQERNQWRILGQHGLFVASDKKISKPGEGKGAGQFGIIGALIYAKTGKWTHPHDPAVMSTIIREAADMAGITPTYTLPSSPHSPSQNERQKESGTQSEEKPIDRPGWPFWTLHEKGTGIVCEIHASLYLLFAESLGFRTFTKRREICIVQETPDGMEDTEERGRLNVTVRQAILDQLKAQDLPLVIDTLLTSPRFFYIDILEQLPEIPREKVRSSIFSTPDTLITLATPILDEHPHIMYGDRGLASQGDIMGIVGRQGIGKSGVCEILASLSLDPECELYHEFVFTLPTSEGKTLWIDSERSQTDMVRSLQRVASRLEVYKHDRITRFLTDDRQAFRQLEVRRCRGVDDKTTWLFELLDSVEFAVNLLIVDSTLSFAHSMNDEQEAKDFFTTLERACEVLGCACIITCHSGSTDKEGRSMGHFGGMLQRMATSYLQVRKSKDDPTVKELTTDFYHSKVRAGSDTGIYAAFQWNDEQHHFKFINHVPPDKPTLTETMQDVAKHLETLFQEQREYHSQAAMARALSKLTGKSGSTCKTHINRAVKEWNLILQTEGGSYVSTEDWTL